MTGWFFFMIYFGGMCTETEEKIGFWNRVFWPAGFGIALMRWSFKQAGTS